MVFAAIFLALLIFRYVYMHSTRPTAMPVDTPPHIWRLARSVRTGMYVSLSLIPVTGLVIGGLYWSGTKSGAVKDSMLLLHEIAVNTSYFLILGHVAAAIHHRWKGDGIWNFMVPVWKERQQ